ncbi:thioredoxin family protein [Burkholderia cepacia]|uniref:thioredoxin family protein n=1 Tax=Burkholderia cepacia TaxID=292 RepID=UPI002AB614E5|nr:thioredoxin domain-containing protein [Burkholderia cepacia]
MSSTLKNTSDAGFESDVLKSDLPVLLDFWAPWCQGCVALEPMLKRYAEKYANRVEVLKLNVDENREIATRYGIRSLPTLIAFAGGKLHTRFSHASADRIDFLLETLAGGVNVVEPESPVPDISPRPALSFGGDAARKDSLLSRLRDTTFDRNENTPSRRIAAGPASPADHPDIPERLAATLDILWLISGQAETAARAHQRVIELVELVPVGIDLDNALRRVTYALLHDAQDGLARYVPHGDLDSLAARIAAAHDDELADIPVEATRWTALVRKAITLTEAYLCQTVERHAVPRVLPPLEMMAVPLDSFNPGLYFLTCPQLAAQRVQEDYLTREETVLLDTLAREITTKVSQQLDPQTSNTQRSAQSRQAREALETQARIAHPVLYARHDAWIRHQREIIVPETLDIATRVWRRELEAARLATVAH